MSDSFFVEREGTDTADAGPLPEDIPEGIDEETLLALGNSLQAQIGQIQQQLNRGPAQRRRRQSPEDWPWKGADQAPEQMGDMALGAIVEVLQLWLMRIATQSFYTREEMARLADAAERIAQALEGRDGGTTRGGHQGPQNGTKPGGR